MHDDEADLIAPGIDISGPTPEQITRYLDRLPSTGTLFVLQRDEDVTGLSGTGVIVDGVIFPDQRVATRWRGGSTGVSQTSAWDSIGEVLRVHRHDGRTMVRRVPVADLIDALKAVLAIPNADKSDYGTDLSAAGWDEALDRVHEAIQDALGEDIALAEQADADRAERRRPPEKPWLRIDLGDLGIVHAIGDNSTELAASVADGVLALINPTETES